MRRRRPKTSLLSVVHSRRLGKRSYLKVSVNDVLLMAVLNCRDDLREKCSGLIII